MSAQERIWDIPGGIHPAERKELSHKEIVELTGFSPAKVSRITKKLEKMGLISQVRQERKKVAVIKPEVRRIILSG